MAKVVLDRETLNEAASELSHSANKRADVVGESCAGRLVLGLVSPWD